MPLIRTWKALQEALIHIVHQHSFDVDKQKKREGKKSVIRYLNDIKNIGSLRKRTLLLISLTDPMKASLEIQV